MHVHKIVLDTNCLLASISSKSENFRVLRDFQAGRSRGRVLSTLLHSLNSSRFKVQGSRFIVQGSKFKVQSSRFKVQSCPQIHTDFEDLFSDRQAIINSQFPILNSMKAPTLLKLITSHLKKGNNIEVDPNIKKKEQPTLAALFLEIRI